MNNRHGLSRTVPPDIKYAIRKEAGFGCVHCGIAIGDYEHIDPEFSEATAHDPAYMTFLCPTMNQKKRRGLLSSTTVFEWKKHPYSAISGKCHDSFDIGSSSLTVWIGGNKVENIERILSIEDTCILGVKPPEAPNAPFRLSAIFHDSSGKSVLEIRDNEWHAGSDAFDVICTNGRIGVRNRDGAFILKIACYPPDVIVIEELDMLYQNTRILVSINKLEVIRAGGQKAYVSGQLITSDPMNPGGSFLNFYPQATVLSLGNGGRIETVKERMPSRPARSTTFPRNASCICGSSIKYKKCCAPRFDYTL